MAQLNATDEQLEYPTMYASAKQGWAIRQLADEKKDMGPLFDTIVEYFKPPQVDPEGKFQMLITTLESDPHMGKIVIGKVYAGKVKPGMPLQVLSHDSKVVEKANVFKVVARRGLERTQMEEGIAGDIVGIAGFSKATAAMTIADPTVTTAIKTIPIDPPVLAMMFSVNKSPFAGKEGLFVVGTKIKQRLSQEADTNVSLSFTLQTEDAYEVKGRGELQLAILIENMRREGYELSIAQPKILMKRDEQTNKLLEPIEDLTIDIESDLTNWTMEELQKRKGDLQEQETLDDGRVRMKFLVPSRCLLGFRAKLMNSSHGQAIFYHTLHGYEEHRGHVELATRGALISATEGVTTAFALANLENRGTLFVGAGVKVYTGMIIGEHVRDGDLEVNPCKMKHVSNVRSLQKEESIRLQAPRTLTLDMAMAQVREDELVEVTPQSIRLRKKLLNASARKAVKKSEEDDDDL